MFTDVCCGEYLFLPLPSDRISCQVNRRVCRSSWWSSIPFYRRWNNPAAAGAHLGCPEVFRRRIREGMECQQVERLPRVQSLNTEYRVETSTRPISSYANSFSCSEKYPQTNDHHSLRHVTPMGHHTQIMHLLVSVDILSRTTAMLDGRRTLWSNSRKYWIWH